MNDSEIIVGELWHPDYVWVEDSGWMLRRTLTPEFAEAVRRENPECFAVREPWWSDDCEDE